jgi:ribosome-binding protein aMBF1 (putative translation factor)
MQRGVDEDEAMKTSIVKSPVMREARRRLGWTQLELARRVGCSESQVTKIETGRLTPMEWLKTAISRELNIHTWEVGI